MLLSLLKILLFFAVILAVALGAVYLSENGHSLQMVYDGTEFILGPVQLFVVLVILAVVSWAALRLLGLGVATLRFLVGDETAIDRYFARSRERKGHAALSESVLAIASGEGKLGRDKAVKAAKYLNRPNVTDVLLAQAAELTGDRAEASAAYCRLLQDDRTRFVGIRGLMQQKLDEGDTVKALQLAQKAYAIKPRHGDLQDTLLRLQTTQGDWKGARATLQDKRRQGRLPKDVMIRRDAVLALQEASEILAKGDSASAREAAISANRASPDLIPAALLAARSHIAQGDSRNASRVLQKAWGRHPHPALAAAYADIVPDETPAARLRRFDNLMRQNPKHEETRLLNAELLLSAEDFPGARRALGDLAQSHPTVRTLSIMAAIERGEGADDAVVRGWLTRALTASRGPQWVCDKCHNVMAEWAPVCDSCGSFDTLTWREPDESQVAAYAPPNGAEMLPLLVGGPDHRPASRPADAEPAAPGPISAAPVVYPAPPAADPHGPAAPSPDGPAEPAARIEIPNVTPGMVPRESDYVTVTDFPEPAMTLTDPDPTPEPSQPKAEESATPDTPPAEPQPDPKASSASRGPRMVSDIDTIPVRPDVEPIAKDGM